MDSPEKPPKRPRKQASKPRKRTKPGQIATLRPDPDQVRQVVAWFVAGATDYEVRRSVESQWPGTDPQPLIGEAYAHFAAHSLRPQIDGETPKIQDVVRGWCFVAYRDLYAKMLATGDFTGALTAVSKIERLAEK